MDCGLRARFPGSGGERARGLEVFRFRAEDFAGLADGAGDAFWRRGRRSGDTDRFLPIMTGMESNAPRMPMVTGMNLAQAQAIISAAIADPQVTIQHSAPGMTPPGTVIGQRPVPGNAVASGSHIELWIATEPVRQGRDG